MKTYDRYIRQHGSAVYAGMYTDRIAVLHVSVGLTQARPNKVRPFPSTTHTVAVHNQQLMKTVNVKTSYSLLCTPIVFIVLLHTSTV